MSDTYLNLAASAGVTFRGLLGFAALSFFPQPCRMTIVTRGGVRHLTFQLGKRQIKFVGRAQTGWWSGRLDGKPAMGFERNRGHVGSGHG